MGCLGSRLSKMEARAYLLWAPFGLSDRCEGEGESILRMGGSSGNQPPIRGSKGHWSETITSTSQGIHSSIPYVEGQRILSFNPNVHKLSVGILEKDVLTPTCSLMSCV